MLRRPVYFASSAAHGFRDFAVVAKPNRGLIYKVRHSDAEHFQIAIRTYINPANAAVLRLLLTTNLPPVVRARLMSNNIKPSHEPEFHLTVKRRDSGSAPWRWEIWAGGRSRYVARSARSFASASEATRDGKAALKALLAKHLAA
jgi:hypothetical protein